MYLGLYRKIGPMGGGGAYKRQFVVLVLWYGAKI